MKLKPALVALSALALTGCASNIVPAGKDTYMIHHGGWPAMNGFACEADCYRDANEFCKERGLVMVPVSTETIDGKVFAHNASSKLIFKSVVSTNTPSAITNSPSVIPATR